jgi:uncharacterized alpha-E superfamily protein
MLRDDIFRFLRLGTFLERADNTARILDVKYHILLPSLADVGGAADYYQWGALLRSVSAFESYRKVYRDVITPRRVAELLILRPTCRARCMPASTRSTPGPGAQRPALHRAAARSRPAARASCATGASTTSSSHGLHEYLTDFLERIYRPRRPDQHHLFLVDRRS